MLTLASWNLASAAQRALWLLAGLSVDLQPLLAQVDAWRLSRFTLSPN